MWANSCYLQILLGYRLPLGGPGLLLNGAISLIAIWILTTVGVDIGLLAPNPRPPTRVLLRHFFQGGQGY